MSRRNPKVLGEWGPEGTRAVGVEKYWNLPHSWNRDAIFDGVRESVFPSLMDPFEDRPDLIPLRERMFSIIDDCRQLDFLLLTKRPQNVRKLWPGEKRNRKNVRLLYSASDQLSLKSGIRALLECGDLVSILGLSLEPLLGEIDLRKWFQRGDKCKDCGSHELGFAEIVPGVRMGDLPPICRRCGGLTVSPISWVIVGGESGPHARPMHPGWSRTIRDQCQAAGVPYFFKQWGEWSPVCDYYEEDDEKREQALDAPHRLLTVRGAEWFVGEKYGDRHDGQPPPGTWIMRKVGKHAAGRILDGWTWDEFPAAAV